jgi:hypothetical protein
MEEEFSNSVMKMKAEIETLKVKNTELEEKLKTYTSNHRHKKYYDNNTEVVIHRAKKYMDKINETNPEKLKEWRHTAYLNRKEKLKAQNNDSVN